ARAALPSLLPNGGRTSGAASSRMTRAAAGSIRRKLFLSVCCASSATWPAISTPVGPAPTITKVSNRLRCSSSSVISACSKQPMIRLRSSSASSTDFMPGAHCSKWSLPKYDWLAPAATIRLSYSRSNSMCPALACTVFEDTVGVLLVAQDQPGRGGDLAHGQDPGGHLVQQGLEEVVSGLGHQGDLDVRLLQLLRGEEPTEPRPDDHDAVPPACCRGIDDL